jgi:hypothetical protein
VVLPERRERLDEYPNDVSTRGWLATVEVTPFALQHSLVRAY